jgi:hypothetical protein
LVYLKTADGYDALAWVNAQGKTQMPINFERTRDLLPAKKAARLPRRRQPEKAVGLKRHQQGLTDFAGRAKLRAELDGLIAHLYGLTEEEFAHVLTTFLLVPDPVKVAARNAYRDVERGLIR